MSTNDGSDLVVDIEKLTLSNNFYDWFITTNKIIDAVNPLNIYDITPGKGLTESRSGGNVILDIDAGKGIKSFPNTGIGKLTLDFESLTEIPSLLNDDLFVVERPGTGDSNNVYKLFATNMLPPILTGNHTFTGTITVSALNVNDNVIRLQYDDTTTENDSGLILDTTTSSKVKFTYDSSIQGWFSNRNVGLNSGYSFVTNSLERRGTFKYGTYGSNQVDTGLELMMGLNSTQSDDKSWIIEARNVSNSLEFIYKSYLNTDTETTIFYGAIDSTNPLTSTFGVKDKIYITNVSDSLNFKNDPSVTTFGRSAYEANIIPIGNSNGILDSKWTNRYVTTQYSGIVVGDIVKILDDTNNQATVVKCSLTSSSDESEAYSLGIVERISGGKAYIATHGEFTNLSGLNPGAVYYLTSGTPNYTLTKPTSGIVKPIFVATSATGGIFFPMNAQGLSFGKVGVVSAAGGTVITTTGTSVTSDAPNDTLTLDAGSGISLETDTSNNKIIIRASTAGNQPTYSSIATNSGTVSAFNPSETLSLKGDGGIDIIATDVASTNGDQITVKGKYFRTISWSGDSTTNDTPGSYTAASYDDTFNIFAGVGIGLSPHPSGQGFRIDATGQAISSVLANSQELNILKVAAGDSVLGYFGGTTPSSVTNLSPSTNSILASTSASRIQWQSPTKILEEKFASTETTNFILSHTPSTASVLVNQRYFGITTSTLPVTGKTPNTNQRLFGMVALPKNSTSVNWLSSINVAPFTYNTLNSINGALLGLLEGDGISLEVNNHSSSVISNIPSIKITNKYGSAFNKISILDTGETIVSNSAEKIIITNYIPYSDDLGENLNLTALNIPTDANGGTGIQYGPYQFGSLDTRDRQSSITGPFGSSTNVARYVPTSSTTGAGTYFGIPRDVYLPGRTFTFSVYAKTETSKNNTKFRLHFYDYKTDTTVFSTEEYTTTSSWQRYTFTFKVDETFNSYPSGGGNVTSNNYSSRILREPGEIYWAGSPAGKRYGTFISPHISIELSPNQNNTCGIYFYGGQLEVGKEATPYISNGSFSNALTDTNKYTADPLNAGTLGSDRWYYNFATAEYVKPESHGTLTLSTAGSPILLDSDTNSDTIYFNIASNSITNNYLATMADNTVKVGTGSTNSDNTPQDLAIGLNSILGRVGNGDLKSVNMTELATMLGTTQFQVVQTDDGGTLLPSESTTIRLRGGSGITTSTGTNNEIIITSTGAPGEGSIGQVASWNNLSSSPSSQTGTFTKLLFSDRTDFSPSRNNILKHIITTNVSGDGAIIESIVDWAAIAGSDQQSGPGLLYARGSKNAATSSLEASFIPVGNNIGGDCLPFLRVPDAGLSELIYLRNATGGSDTIQRVIGFKSDGTLVATTATGITSITFDSTKITGLSATAGTITASDIVSFPSMSSSRGFYFGESNSLGLYMDDEGSNGTSNFILATSDTPTFGSGYVASLIIGARNLGTTWDSTKTFFINGKTSDIPTSTSIKARLFGVSSEWANLSVSSGYSPRLCMPDFLIGDGPSSPSSVSGSGSLLRNDTTNNSLTFTNYNLGASKTIAKDRSCRLGLEILDVDTPSNNAYANTKTTAYITHTHIPRAQTTTTVDQFTLPNSSKKSYKYFIHAQNAAGDFYTTELLIQVNGTTTNIIQYASGVNPTTSTLSVNFSVSATSGTNTTVTLTHNNTANSLDIKLLKYEI